MGEKWAKNGRKMGEKWAKNGRKIGASLGLAPDTRPSVHLPKSRVFYISFHCPRKNASEPLYFTATKDAHQIALILLG